MIKKIHTTLLIFYNYYGKKTHTTRYIRKSKFKQNESKLNHSQQSGITNL